MEREYNPDELVLPYSEEKDGVTVPSINLAVISEKEAKKYKVFSQYTNAETLFSIIKDKNLKFARLDNLNDLMEAEQFYDDKYKNLVYISCFSYRLDEYIPHWIMYTKLGYGVRITFEVEEGKEFNKEIIDDARPLIAIRDDWTRCDFKKEIKHFIKDFKTHKVQYTADRLNKGGYSRGLDVGSVAVQKHKDWKFEDEVRIRLMLYPTRLLTADLDFAFFLAPIKFDKIKLTITFSPWMAESLKEVIKDFCEKNLQGVNYSCVDSSLEKAVKLK